VLAASGAVALGWCVRSRRDPRRPHEKTRWELWSRDLFDRETPPRRDREGEGIVPGLAALWERAIREGIDDRGDRSFTDFSLQWGRTIVERAEVNVVPFGNPGLAKLRRWNRADLHKALGEAHARLLASSDRWDAPGVNPSAESKPLLERARDASTPQALLDALAKVK
jgi:hypothetical protein